MAPKQASKPGSQVVVAHSATPSFPQYTHIQLPDPKTGNLRTYYLTDANLLEATRYKQQHSSWLVNDDVISDGGLLMLTPVDPLLLLLPRLVQARKQSAEHVGVFCQIDQLLPHDEHPEILALLTRAAPQLRCICDVKQVEDDPYYRLNDNRALAWLVCKARSTQAVVMDLVFQNHCQDTDQGLAYAVGVLGEYLSSEWLKKLEGLLGVDRNPAAAPGTQAVEPVAAQADKRPRVDPKEAAKQKAAQSRAVTKAAQLAKTAAGSKKISSFFTKKKA